MAQLDEEHAIVYVPVGPGAAGVANMDGSGAARDTLDRLARHNHRVGVQPHLVKVRVRVGVRVGVRVRARVRVRVRVRVKVRVRVRVRVQGSWP